jgi:hypothetical protein
VRDLGEVFTPLKTVNEMLDLLPQEIWARQPEASFLEPACGDGNFIVEILDRKLQAIKNAPPRPGVASDRLFLGLGALSSIYGIDISLENIAGNPMRHEIGARQRVLDQFLHWAESADSGARRQLTVIRACAEWIISHNILVGNMLEKDQRGTPTGRDQIPIIEYRWDHAKKLVTVFRTCLGDIQLQSETSYADMLWGPPEPQAHWTGTYTRLAEAPMIPNPFETSVEKLARIS